MQRFSVVQSVRRALRSTFERLDSYATDDPDFNEGHPEDRCPLCERPVVDHPTWRHRIHALWPVVARALRR